METKIYCFGILLSFFLFEFHCITAQQPVNTKVYLDYTAPNEVQPDLEDVRESMSLNVLIITGIKGNTKVYDGTTTATTSGSAILKGIKKGDDVYLSGNPIFNFNNKDVGKSINILTQGYYLSGPDAFKYTLIKPMLQADITELNLTITGLVGDTKEYDGTTLATASGIAKLNGVITGDDVKLTGMPSFVFENENVGERIHISTTGFFITGSDVKNYTFSSPLLAADITPKIPSTGISAY